MRKGNYEHLIPATGPPEIRRSAEEANELRSTLKRLSQNNRSLLHRFVSLQDNERRDMARELHDELGRFAIWYPGQRRRAAGGHPERQGACC